MEVDVRNQGRFEMGAGEMGMRRRAPGTLEAEVLATLWSVDQPLSAEDVRVRLAADLAYTTVATILTRLHEKGAVNRTLTGRVYSYAPVLDHAALTALRMQALLDDESDRAGVLNRFVDGLDGEGLGALREALDHRSER
ncbi:MAG: BlaI/MecI/CopY family transcriptional regulator [Acidimicrobiales bacterium]|nr:BlaI/MecI/CopY family transcriptional regulator [Acidimicrobiales bacterium]